MKYNTKDKGNIQRTLSLGSKKREEGKEMNTTTKTHNETTSSSLVTVWFRINHFNISISDSKPVVDGSIPDYSALCTGCSQMTPRLVTAGICHHPLMKVCSKPELCIDTRFELIGSAIA